MPTSMIKSMYVNAVSVPLPCPPPPPPAVVQVHVCKIQQGSSQSVKGWLPPILLYSAPLLPPPFLGHPRGGRGGGGGGEGKVVIELVPGMSKSAFM